MALFSRLKCLVLLLTTLLLAACSGDEPTDISASKSDTARTTLRVILPSHPQGLSYLPRSGLPDNDEYQLFEQYARANDIDIEKVYVDHYDQLIPTLLAGNGDIIVNNLTVTEERKELVDFAAPIAFVHEQLIGRPGDTPKTAHELEGRKVAVHRSAAFFHTLGVIQQQRFQPPFEIVEVDENIPTEEIIKGVADGRYDLTVADSNLLERLPQESGISIGFDIGPVRPIAWAIHKDNRPLLTSLNDFIGRHHLLGGSIISQGDLSDIKKRKVLRVLTRNNASTYFLWRGELHGFEYELARRFAEKHGLRLEMVVPPSRDLLIPWLLEGKGDIVAASMTINGERQQQGLRFSRPYNTISEIVVSRSEDTIENPDQLAGRRVVVRRSSSYWQSLEALQQLGIEFELIAAPEEMETEEIIARVARGEFDLTVADSHILDIELTWRDDIRAAFALQQRKHGWLVREGNPELLKAVNAFHKKEYRGLFYNVTYNKYFKNTKRIRQSVEERADSDEANSLSPYDDLVVKHAEHYGFDWRLIVSQMFQESRFDPNAKSWVGALGLMQVMPRTAKEFGITDLRDPDQGVHAGVQYLNWLLKRFEPELDIGERTWFALAAYNAGIGHVRDARRLARKKGWDGDKWFGNVERAMLLLSKKKYSKKAKHGYVRGHEPVNYVRQIRDRYMAYIKLKEEKSLAQLDNG